MKVDLQRFGDQIKHIEVEIRSLSERRRRALQALNNWQIKYNVFASLFRRDHPGLYIAGGIICISILVFDFWVSKQSLEYLAILIRVPKEFLAVLFSLVDGFLAILASGLFAGHDRVKRQRQVVIGTTILLLLALTKLVLFVVLIFDYNPYIELFDERFNSVVLPQVFFIALVFLILKFFGSGLWYLVGHFYFRLYRLLLDDIEKINEEICEHFVSIESILKENGTELEKYIVDNGLQTIYSEAGCINRRSRS